MKSPLTYRKNIPFFYQKSEVEYQKDPYERYEEMVTRQSAIHLADELWGRYPMQPVLDFARPYYPTQAQSHIVEIGCGVGRWIASLADQYPDSVCWGIDYSYQMLKRAQEFWVDGKTIEINYSSKGFTKNKTNTPNRLTNLNFGLAKAADLPFDDQSQDLVISSFLIDRVDHPQLALTEMHRILKPKGQLLLLTPLNFNQSKNWELFYPAERLVEAIKDVGFDVLKVEEGLEIREEIDVHGNFVCWGCLGVVAGR